MSTNIHSSIPDLLPSVGGGGGALSPDAALPKELKDSNFKSPPIPPPNPAPSPGKKRRESTEARKALGKGTEWGAEYTIKNTDPDGHLLI